MAPSVDTAATTAATAPATTIPVKKVLKSTGPTLRKRKSTTTSNASDASGSLDSTFGEVEVQDQTFLWGCELKRSKDTFVAKYPGEGEAEYPEFHEDYPERHHLVLKGATLGADAQEKDRNVVEVHFQTASGEEQRLTIASLTIGMTETCRLDLSMSWTKGRDITFKLVKGSGPVSLLGNHIVTASVDGDADDSLFVPDAETATEDEMEQSGMSTDGDDVEATEVKDLEADKEKPVTGSK